MSESPLPSTSASSQTPAPSDPNAPVPEAATVNSKYMAKPGDSYTKLAMRNMVRRGGTSVFHFGLTTAAVLGFLVGISYLFH